VGDRDVVLPVMWATAVVISQPVLAMGAMFVVCWVGLSVEVTRVGDRNPRGRLDGVHSGDRGAGSRRVRVSSARRVWSGYGQHLRCEVGELGQQAHRSVDVSGRGSVHGVRIQDLGEGVERVERCSGGRGHAAQS
jgi:hypothetical protein